MSNLLAELRAQFESELLRSRSELHPCNPYKSTPDIEPIGKMNGQGREIHSFTKDSWDLWEIYRLNNGAGEVMARFFRASCDLRSVEDEAL